MPESGDRATLEGVETLVPVELKRLPAGELVWCVDPIHGDDEDGTRATWWLKKPDLTPPLPGPKHLYLCDRCVANFLASAAGTYDED